MKKESGKGAVVLGLLLIGAFSLGVLAQRFHIIDDIKTIKDAYSTNSRQIREQSTLGEGEGNYKLINPLLECEVAEGMIDAYKENFQDELSVAIDELKKNGEVSTVAVYFRDLNNGPTFGLNQDEGFIPASLLKVPVMMSYFKSADEDASILDREILYSEKIDLDPTGSQLIAPRTQIEVGKKYLTSELIERTIKYSDNAAVTLLIYNLPGGPIRHLYKMLGVSEDVLNGPGGHLTVKEYSAFFRILYNSSYLSHEYSEKALDLLTKTEFDQGLRAGVPPEIVVAHKFGEGGDVNEHQIHDCGIVYYPGHPYLLCIMSRGKEIAKLEGAVAKISAFVYKKIADEYGKQSTTRQE